MNAFARIKLEGQMVGLNHCIISGKVFGNPRSARTAKGHEVCDFRIQVPDNSVFDCVAYGQTAEKAEKLAEVGKALTVLGKLKVSSWIVEGELRRQVQIYVSEVRDGEVVEVC